MDKHTMYMYRLFQHCDTFWHNIKNDNYNDMWGSLLWKMIWMFLSLSSSIAFTGYAFQKSGSNLFQHQSVGRRWHTTKHVERSNQKPQLDWTSDSPLAAFRSAVFFILVLTGTVQDVTLTYTDIHDMYGYMFTKVPLPAVPGPLEFLTRSDKCGLDLLASDLWPHSLRYAT